MFAYCLNNPVMYQDSNGQHAMMPPLVINGLNLPPEGGIAVIIDGVLYYYAISYNSSGELFEYWFNSSGDLIHVRHHSTHNRPHTHNNPHDHTGYRDDRGNNTHTKGPEPVDEKFQPPSKKAIDEKATNVRIPTTAFPQTKLAQYAMSIGGAGGGCVCVAVVAGRLVGTLLGRFAMTTSYAY